LFIHSSTVYIMLVILIVGFASFHLFKLIYNRIEENKYHSKLASSGIRDIDKMDGLQFEFYLRALFKELGYKTMVTKGSNDFGADLIIKKNNKTIVIQAKRYKYKRNVGIDAVQQIYTAIPYYKANKGWIITNSYYTKNAKKLASVCGIKLFDRKKLVQFIDEINPSVTPKQVKQTIPPKERKCPKCKSALVVRHNKKGDAFFGCSNYPDCKHTEPVAN